MTKVRLIRDIKNFWKQFFNEKVIKGWFTRGIKGNIPDWLNVTPRTLRNYTQQKTTWNESFKEHLLLLLGLFKHGHKVFGTSVEFDEWLKIKNFYFDDCAPVTFLNTVTGVRFVDNSLTAMEFGDNV